MPGPQVIDVGAQAGAEVVALGGAQHAERGERGGGVGRTRRGGEDVGAGSVHQEVGVPARPGHEAAERTEGLRQRADPQHGIAAVVAQLEGRGEDAVCLVEHEQRAVVRAHVDELVDRRDVTVHGEDGLGDDDRPRPGVGAQQLVDVGARRDGGRPRGALRARRRPSMSDAWFSSSEHTSVSGPANVVSTPRLAANPVVNSTAASVSFHAGQLGFELVVHRARADDRAAPLRPPVPQRSMASWAAATTAGWWVRPR